MSPEGSQKPDTSRDESFAARLKKEFGEGVDPGVSLAGERAEPPSGATSELLKRLAEHGVKSPRYKLEGEVAHHALQRNRPAQRLHDNMVPPGWRHECEC
jgi:hypothetical protein